jgi:hypothetical protein
MHNFIMENIMKKVLRAGRPSKTQDDRVRAYLARPVRHSPWATAGIGVAWFAFFALCAIMPAFAMDSYRLHKPPRITAEQLRQIREEYSSYGEDPNAPKACDGEVLSWALAVTDETRAFCIGQNLIQIGAINYINTAAATTPLLIAAHRQFQSVVQMLIEAGADIFYATENGYTALTTAKEQTSKLLLRALTRLSKEEKESIKNWLLIHKKMELEQNLRLPKDIRILIAESICKLIAQDVYARIIRAGALKALEIANEGVKRHSLTEYNSKIRLLEHYLDLSFLGRSVVLPQILLPKQTQSSDYTCSGPSYYALRASKDRSGSAGSAGQGRLKCLICKDRATNKSSSCCNQPVCPECFMNSLRRPDDSCPFWCKDQDAN